jgi:hypothetical protein
LPQVRTSTSPASWYIDLFLKKQLYVPFRVQYNIEANHFVNLVHELDVCDLRGMICIYID